MIRVQIEPQGRGRFRALLGSQILVTSSTDPERAACRALVAMGLAGPMVTRWLGAKHDAMHFACIESAALLTTIDEAKRGLRQVNWRPHSANDEHAGESSCESGCVSPPAGICEPLPTTPYPISNASVAPLYTVSDATVN